MAARQRLGQSDQTGMTVATICTWNLKASGGKSASKVPLMDKRIEVIRALLASDGPVIVALQQVTPGYAQSLASLGLQWSLAHWQPGPFDGGNRLLGVGLLTGKGVTVRRTGVVERAPFPERTLIAEIDIAGRAVELLAFHALTGVGYRNAKHSQFRSLAEHLSSRVGRAVFLGDANEPMVDARERSRIRCWDGNGDDGKGAALLFGPEPVHGLVDAWRTWMHPDELERVPPDGPLAVSYVRNDRNRRYDHIYLPEDWKVQRMAYDLQRATDAGSDHAVVTAQVLLSDA